MTAMEPLSSCRPGLFTFNGNGMQCLGFKSEYKTESKSHPGFWQSDAYVVESGEYFWGGTSDPTVREGLLVTPYEALLPAQRGEEDVQGVAPRGWRDLPAAFAQRGEGGVDDVERVARAMMTAEYGSHVPVSKIMRKRAERAIAALPRSTEGSDTARRAGYLEGLTMALTIAQQHSGGQAFKRGAALRIAEKIEAAIAAAPAAGPERRGDCAGGVKLPWDGPCPKCGATEDEACRYDTTPDATITSTVERIAELEALLKPFVRACQFLEGMSDADVIELCMEDGPLLATIDWKHFAAIRALSPAEHAAKDGEVG